MTSSLLDYALLYAQQEKEMLPPWEILRQAADYIDLHGWTKGVYKNPMGEVCALGGLDSVETELVSKAHVSPPVAWNSVYHARRALLQAIPGRSIPRWNDTRKSGEEVTAFMRKLADKLEAKATRKAWYKRLLRK